MPNIYYLILYEEYYSLAYHFFGTGYGILTEYAEVFGFTPGATGRVKFHDSILDNDHIFIEDHPKFHLGLFPAWSVEIREMPNI